MARSSRRWMRVAGLCTALVLAGCRPSDRARETATETDHLEAARALAERGSYDSAIQRYALAVDGGADAAVALNERGVARAAKGEHRRAAADFDSALALRPGYASALSNLAVAHLELARWDRALAVLDSLAVLRPREAKVYYDRAHAHEGKGRRDRALEDLARALELDPELTGAYLSRGRIHARRGDLDLAIADFEKAVSLSRSDAARKNHGVARLEAGDHRKADRIFTELLSRSPLEARLHLYRGRARRGLGRVGDAAEDFRRTLELTGNPALRQQAITALREMGAGH